MLLCLPWAALHKEVVWSWMCCPFLWQNLRLSPVLIAWLEAEAWVFAQEPIQPSLGERAPKDASGYCGHVFFYLKENNLVVALGLTCIYL